MLDHVLLEHGHVHGGEAALLAVHHLGGAQHAVHGQILVSGAQGRRQALIADGFHVETRGWAGHVPPPLHPLIHRLQLHSGGDVHLPPDVQASLIRGTLRQWGDTPDVCALEEANGRETKDLNEDQRGEHHADITDEAHQPLPLTSTDTHRAPVATSSEANSVLHTNRHKAASYRPRAGACLHISMLIPPLWKQGEGPTWPHLLREEKRGGGRRDDGPASLLFMFITVSNNMHVPGRRVVGGRCGSVVNDLESTGRFEVCSSDVMLPLVNTASRAALILARR